ncbi:MAG TPA: 3'(2'),5'-bisphosphate nucleotidase CysQ [Geminicoccaceae bacterium]
MSPPDADRDLLRSAIEAACELALRHFEAPRGHWHKAPGQVVTEADLEVDALLHDRLLGARPGYGWLSEERPDDGSRRRAERIWMVDPIDGTRAFVEGKPEFTISVALLEDGRPRLAAIANPVTGERFEAAGGGAARLNGAPCRVTGRTALAGARLLSSRGEIRERRWRELMPEAEIQTMGSLAYKLALVAAGRFDGFVSLRRTYDWDVAAAVLLLERAGGVLSDARNAPLRLNGEEIRHQGLIAAATPELHAALRSRIGPG